jgi:DNA-binding response OmpR family regulator
MPKKILVIEDDDDILDMMQYILEDEGFEVIASNKVELLTSIIKSQPDLILLDDRLPEDSGHNLCANIKSHPETTTIPVILISATANLNQVAKDCNADTYLTKPFDLYELVKLVKNYV